MFEVSLHLERVQSRAQCIIHTISCQYRETRNLVTLTRGKSIMYSMFQVHSNEHLEENCLITVTDHATL